jgi:putative Mg2+ transporter-C (MgtC) family protein
LIPDWPELGLQAAKLGLAVILGAVLGLEREAHGRYAGIRTNILVSVGSCLLMMLSLQIEVIFRAIGAESAVRLDPGRVASYAIAGMGFIGAGTIVKGKGSVRGVTTAATLWTLTGVGMAVGAGFYLPAVFATLISFTALHGLRRLRLVKDEYTTLTLSFSDMSRPLEQIRGILLRFDKLRIQGISYDFNIEAKLVTYRFYLRNPSTAPVCNIMDNLMTLPDLKNISWEKAPVP